MTLYLIDANVLIRAHEDFYPIDRIPQFWNWLQGMAEQGTVKMPLQIYDEVAPFRGPLPDWLKQQPVREALVLAETASLSQVQHVLSQGYASDPTDVEIEEIGQDPFLIAAAMRTSDRVVVTREGSKPSATRARRKIPDVCAGFGISVITDYELYRRLNFRIA